MPSYQATATKAGVDSKTDLIASYEFEASDTQATKIATDAWSNSKPQVALAGANHPIICRQSLTLRTRTRRRMGKREPTVSPPAGVGEAEEIGGRGSRNGMAAAALADVGRHIARDCWPNWDGDKPKATGAGSGRTDHRAKSRAVSPTSTTPGSSRLTASKESALMLIGTKVHPSGRFWHVETW
jgi:hypothetical protein